MRKIFFEGFSAPFSCLLILCVIIAFWAIKCRVSRFTWSMSVTLYCNLFSKILSIVRTLKLIRDFVYIFNWTSYSFRLACCSCSSCYNDWWRSTLGYVTLDLCGFNMFSIPPAPISAYAGIATATVTCNTCIITIIRFSLNTGLIALSNNSTCFLCGFIIRF